MATAERPKMASLLGEVLFEIDGQGPAPSKDFYQLIITQKEVIWRWWKISMRSEFRGIPPGEIKHSHNYFVQDSALQEQLGVVFGRGILEYTLSLCQGDFDYLERLPDQLLLKILSYVSVQDIGHLSQTSRRFLKLCNSEEFWKSNLSHFNVITEDMEKLGKAMGWKKLFILYYKQEQHCLAEEDEPNPVDSPTTL
nr:F-box only protein 36a [Misgurnus anguillicaudatus]XP_055029588.1 F-box only protein 36a [Misgurnus anguillicaudatus]